MSASREREANEENTGSRAKRRWKSKVNSFPPFEVLFRFLSLSLATNHQHPSLQTIDMANVERWVREIPPITRAWVGLCIASSIAVVSSTSPSLSSSLSIDGLLPSKLDLSAPLMQITDFSDLPTF